MNKQKSKFNVTKLAIICSVLATSLSLGSSALAFSDLSGDPAEAKINSLRNSNIINGISTELFAPKSKVTYAQGLQFLINAFNLQLDNHPSKASDHFDKVADDAWYAKAFLIAHDNGLAVDKTVNPSDTITRAQFAHLVNQSLLTKGNFPVTLMYVHISDGENLSSEVSNSLQTLLNTGIITLSENNGFRPNDGITRSEAAIMIYNSSEFAKKIVPEQKVIAPKKTYKTSISIEKVTQDVNKVSLTVHDLPNPGYSASIERIEFGPDLTATVYYVINNPDPDLMYTQVISKSTAVTYLSAKYKAVAQYEATSIDQSDPSSLMLPFGEAPNTSNTPSNPEDLIAK
ncbi:S-layer homology domain-containing protein [Paenibacillus sp. FA6]|uniref:S-layer homology domain-containing protein n=1 Tax=Paenibacillus sp. FA6 TaxID=3413029 RepID=UPI003F65B7FD